MSKAAVDGVGVVDCPTLNTPSVQDLHKAVTGYNMVLTRKGNE